MRYQWKDKKPTKHKIIILLIIIVLGFVGYTKIKSCKVKAVGIDYQDFNSLNTSGFNILTQIKLPVRRGILNPLANSEITLLSMDGGAYIMWQYNVDSNNTVEGISFKCYERHGEIIDTFELNYNNTYIERVLLNPLELDTSKQEFNETIDIFLNRLSNGEFQLWYLTENHQARQIYLDNWLTQVYTDLYVDININASDLNNSATARTFFAVGEIYTGDILASWAVENAPFFNSFGYYNMNLYYYGVNAQTWSKGYENGQNVGYWQGYETGYVDGGNNGYQTGYEDGYSEGVEATEEEAYNRGVQDGINDNFARKGLYGWVQGIFVAISGFLSIKLGNTLTIGGLLVIPLAITLCWAILKMMRGGGS